MTLTVISESRVSAIFISTLVAGQAIATRMITGMIVNTISALSLCDHVAGIAPRDLRKRNIAMPIAPNTNMPMTMQIHSTIMCRS